LAGEGNEAEVVASAFLAGGPNGVERLEGSFLIVLIDERANLVYLWTDPTGSLPWFRAVADEHLVVVPELKCLTGLGTSENGIVPGSLASMVVNASLIGEHTYWRDVELIGPARRLTIEDGRVRVSRYWRRQFQPAGGCAPSAGQVAEVVQHATVRHLSRFRSPVLALSGGLDSRAILAAAIRADLNLPAVTWGMDRLDLPGSDYQTGLALARRWKLTHRARPVDVDLLPDHAERVVYLTDGLTGHIANHAEGVAVAAELARDHDAVVFGNEMFGWGRTPRSRNDALEHVGINTGKRLSLLRFLLRPEVADSVFEGYRAQCHGVLEPLRGEVDVADMADVLYWLTRFPRLIVSQAPVYRRYLSYISPLLDREVLDLTARCTPRQRANKTYAEDALRRSFAEQFEVPLNSKHSRVNWQRRLGELGRAQRFMVETLLEPLDSFDEWFDRAAIHAWLAAASAEGRMVPNPQRVSWYRQAALRAKAFALRPTFKHRVILNLVTLKLWFGLSESSRHGHATGAMPCG